MSICIPAYNNIESLIRLLNSIEIQTYQNVEIVITDDSKTDSLESYISKYKLLNIRYYKNEKQLGATLNCNKAMSLANGDYIKIMHHDDWFSNKFSLEKLVNLLLEDCNASFVCSGTYQVSDVSIYQRSITHEQAASIKKNYKKLYMGNYIGAPSAVIFKKNANKFDENLVWLVDLDFYLRLLKENSQFLYTVEPLISIGINDKQLTNKCENDSRLIIKEYLYLFEKYALYKNNILYTWYLLKILYQNGAEPKDYRTIKRNRVICIILHFFIILRYSRRYKN